MAESRDLCLLKAGESLGLYSDCHHAKGSRREVSETEQKDDYLKDASICFYSGRGEAWNLKYP